MHIKHSAQRLHKVHAHEGICHGVAGKTPRREVPDLPHLQVLSYAHLSPMMGQTGKEPSCEQPTVVIEAEVERSLPCGHERLLENSLEHGLKHKSKLQIVVGYLDSLRTRMLTLHDVHSVNHTGFQGIATRI